MKILLVLSAGRLLRQALSAGRPSKAWAPTTLVQLRALVPPELDAEVELVDLAVERLEDDFEADLLGISAMTCAAPEAYRLADLARARGIKVVMGGYHASVMRDEALAHADAVVAGFAEESWPRLLRDFAAGRLQRVYEDESTGTTFVSPPLDRSLLGKRKYFTTHTLEATRGCPHGCGFCVIPPFTRRRYVHRPLRDVVQDIERMRRDVLFLDSNPFDFPDYMKSLCAEIAPLKATWYAGSTLDFARNDELVGLAARAGCKGVLIGFESVDQGSLDGTGKRFNQAEAYRSLVHKLHDNGIAVLGSFALGLDHDDPSIFERTVEFVVDNKIDLVKLGIVTPLPGSALFTSLKKQDRLLTEDWERYDTNHCVFRPARMTPEQLEAGFQRAYGEIYKLSSIVRRVLRRGAPYVYALAANLIGRRYGDTF